MQQSSIRDTQPVSIPQAPAFSNDELRTALNNWRHEVLAWLGREMLETSEELRDAEAGLAISCRNPGQIADDVVDILWDKLNAKAIQLRRLDRVIDRIEEMDLPQLIILFQRTNKVPKRYAWEDDAWELPQSIS